MLRIIRDFCLNNFISDSVNKDIVLYSDLQYVGAIKRVFSNIDIDIKYVALDTDDVTSTERSVYDIAFEDYDSIMVLVCKDDFFYGRKILEGLGLKLGVNFKSITRGQYETYSTPYYYDPVLGYNLYTDNEFTNGFKVFGNDSNPIKIVTLGGSTSDACLYPFKSWTEYLYDFLVKNDVSCTVLAGGVAAYSSSEELFKLIRDVVAIKPHMVLNYSGINDFGLDKFPRINIYMNSIAEYLLRNNSQSCFNMNPFGVTYGVKEELNSLSEQFQFWYNNQKMMHNICKCMNIVHYTFFQPSLCNGEKTISVREREYLLNTLYVGREMFDISYFTDMTIDYRKCFDKIVVKSDKNWLYDFSDIFNDEDVYMDICHVNDEGNSIIAKKILDIVNSALQG